MELFLRRAADVMSGCQKKKKKLAQFARPALVRDQIWDQCEPLVNVGATVNTQPTWFQSQNSHTSVNVCEKK